MKLHPQEVADATPTGSCWCYHQECGLKLHPQEVADAITECGMKLHPQEVDDAITKSVVMERDIGT